MFLRILSSPGARVRRAFAATLAPLVVGVLAGCASDDLPRALPDPIAPPQPVRMVAEWEPALGAVVTYPFGIPDELVVALTEGDDTLFVLVDPGDQDALGEELRELGVGRRGYRAITAPVGSRWTRDFGPHQIVDGEGRLAVLDQVFQGYPVYPVTARRDRVDTLLEIFPDRRGDDRMAEVCAAYFDLPRFVAPFVLTGGNFLVDGRGTAFYTDALVDENAAWFDTVEFEALTRRFTGCTKLVHLPNVEEVGIQHIDCWLKVLPGNRLLVQRPPADHPAHARLEAAVAELREVRDAQGEPFEILRIDCPVVERTKWGEEEPLAAYTNAVILNARVFVPLYGVVGDAAALETFRAALPDHEVLGFEHDDWESYDALHCRVRAIFDPEQF